MRIWSSQVLIFSITYELIILRVIRVPETEKMGRLHSSTASVIILPEVPMTFQMLDKDLKFEYMRSSGAGGQHVNKTESACRQVYSS